MDKFAGRWEPYVVYAALLLLVCFPGRSLAVCPVSCALCPCFATSPYTFTIDEDAPIGTTIDTITATSPSGSSLTYSTQSSTFIMDSATGLLTVGDLLDYESRASYQFTVIATDGAYEGSGQVTVDLRNRNDNPPQCPQNVIYFSLLENQTSASYKLPNCTDDDSPVNPEFSYEVNSSFSNLFNIDADGRITLTQPLDFEERSIYDLSIRVNDTDIPPGSLSTWIRAIVTVEPANEFTPVFADNSLAFNVSENSTLGTVVGQVSASDEDIGKDGEVNYSIDPTQTDSFVVDAITGDIILVSKLDYESSTSHAFSVTATDSSVQASARRSATTSITINVVDSNDNVPVFPQPVYFLEVVDNTASGSLLAQLSCGDLDSGRNKKLVYSILSGNDRGFFDIEESSGNLSLVARIDDSTSDSDFYSLTVQCEEEASPNRVSETLFLISVISTNSYSPQPTDIEFLADVPEDTLPGAVLTQVQARDNDGGLEGILRYYINYQVPNCPDDVISIDESSGEVYLISPLNYESGIREIVCTVTISDSGYPIRSSLTDLLVTVTNVNDEPPKCYPSISTVYLSENSSIGGTILQVPCNDSDSSNLKYSLLSAQTVPFEMEASGSLVLQSSLDYETVPFYLLFIEVSDGFFAANTTIGVVVENVNEYTPVFSQQTYHCSVNEDAPIGTMIPCGLSAVDEDSGKAGDVKYTLNSFSNLFSLSSEGQLVLTAPGVDNATQAEHLLEIEAYDLGSPPLSSRAFINLTVLAVINNVPNMQPFLFESIPENSPPGTTVTSVLCTDIDDGPDGEVELSIVEVSQLLTNNEYRNVTELQLFHIDPADGEVSVLGDLDLETTEQYKLLIICRDHGNPSLSSVASLLVEVLPQNEHPPVIVLPSSTLQVPEQTRIGTFLTEIRATDGDHGADGRVDFSLSSTLDPAPFEINRRSGVIVLSGTLDCDLTVEYHLTVLVEDQGQPQLSSQANLTVNVTTCHLGGIEPDRFVYSMSVAENALSGESLGRVSCTSTRTNISTDITPFYRIASGDLTHFAINSVSGEITVLVSPDYELQASHRLMVDCYDPNHQHITNTFSVFIDILPVNEYTPDFSEPNFRVNISENTPLGTLIMQLQADDQDEGQDGELIFSIISQDQSSTFMINQLTGEVYLTAHLDRETVDELTFTVVAQDSSTNATLQRSSAASVTVSVTDVNDNWPHCGQVVHHLVISPRTAAPKVLVDDFMCTDADLNENSELLYEISDSSPSEDLFEIDSGRLLLRSNFNSDGPSQYYLTVSVRDRGDPSFATDVLIIVDVQEPTIVVDSTNLESLVQEEGKRNAIWIQLRDLSIESWERTDAEEKFKEVVAKSVTHFCALLPEACSIVSGCSEFYGIREKRSIQDNNYAKFFETSVTILSASANSSRSADSTTSLDVQFYVTLPTDISRSPNRETNHVVPGATLNSIVEEDGQTIEAVVRDNVVQQSIESSLPTSAIVGLSVVGGTGVGVLIMLFCCLIALKVKRNTKVGLDIAIGREGIPQVTLTTNSLKEDSESSSMSGVSDRAVCDTPHKQSAGNLAKLARLVGLGGLHPVTSRSMSKHGRSSNSSSLSTRAVCDDKYGNHVILTEIYRTPSTSTDYELEDDDISVISLKDETSNSGGTSMENIPSHCGQGGTGRRILGDLLRGKKRTPPPQDSIPLRSSLTLPLPKWK